MKINIHIYILILLHCIQHINQFTAIPLETHIHTYMTYVKTKKQKKLSQIILNIKFNVYPFPLQDGYKKNLIQQIYLNILITQFSFLLLYTPLAKRIHTLKFK